MSWEVQGLAVQVEERGGDKAADTLDRLGKEAKAAARALNQLADELDDTTAAEDRTSASSGNLFSQLGSVKGLIAGLGVGALAAGLYQAGKAVIDVGSSFETLGVQMTSVLGSSALGEQAASWIKDFTQNTPYQLQQVSDAFVKLENFGLAPASGSLQAIADQTSLLGGDMQVMDSLILSLGKSWQKGVLGGEEYTMMLERGIPVTRYLAEGLGISEQAVIGLKEQGKLGKDAIKLLIDTMGDSSIGASASLMDTYAGKVSNLVDALTVAANEIAQGGLLDAATDTVGGLIDQINDMTASGELRQLGADLGSMLAELATNIPPVVHGLGEIVLALPVILDTAKGIALVFGTMWSVNKVNMAVEAIKDFRKAQLAAAAATEAASIAQAANAAGAVTAAKGVSGISMAGKALVTFLGGPWVIGLAAAAGAIYGLVKAFDYLEEKQRKAITELGKSSQELNKAFMVELKKMADESGMTVDQLVKKITGMTVAEGGLDKAMEMAGKSSLRLNSALVAAKESLAGTKKPTEELAKNLNVVTGVSKETLKALEKLENEVKDKLAAAIKKQFKALEEGFSDTAVNMNGIWVDVAQNIQWVWEEDVQRWVEKPLEIDAPVTYQFYRELDEVKGEFLGMKDAVEGNPIILPPLDSRDMRRALTDLELRVMRPFGEAISDIVLLMATGRLDELNDTLMGFFSSLASDAAGTAGDLFTTALQNSFTESGFSFDKLFEGTLGSEDFLQNAGMAIGSGFVTQAMQTGDWVSGLIGGAMMGWQATGGNPWGALIGGVVGAVSAAFAEDKTPRSSLTIDPSLFYGVVAGQQYQHMKEPELQSFSADLYSQYRALALGFRKAAQMFGDVGLFDLMGNMPTWSTGEGMVEDVTLPELADWLVKIKLPEQFMTDTYGDVFRQGIQGLTGWENNSDLMYFFQGLASLPGAERLDALTTFIGSLRGITELMSSMSRDSLEAELAMGSLAQFTSGVQTVIDNMHLLSVGWEDMLPVDRAYEAQQIADMILDVRTLELNMLSQIDDMQKGMIKGWDTLSEDINLAGMTENQQAQYYLERIRAIQDMFRSSDVLDPEVTTEYQQELQGYVRALFGLWQDKVGDQANPWGDTFGDVLQGIIAESRDLGILEFDQARDVLHDATQDVIDELGILRLGLIDLNGIITSLNDNNPYNDNGPDTDNPDDPTRDENPDPYEVVNNTLSGLATVTSSLAEFNGALAGISAPDISLVVESNPVINVEISSEIIGDIARAAIYEFFSTQNGGAR